VQDIGGETIQLRDGRRLGYAELGDPGGHPLLYLHGFLGSRVEGRVGDEAAKATGVRVIGLDRPGMGLSDFQPARSFLNWPEDVSRWRSTRAGAVCGLGHLRWESLCHGVCLDAAPAAH
jgi:pimeloyl-ACP methyl ester carboxylesterase